MDEPVWYEISIQGRIGPLLAASFAELQIVPAGGDTLLVGPLIDQAALHGVLMRIRDLGLPLLAVRQVPANEIHDY